MEFTEGFLLNEYFAIFDSFCREAHRRIALGDQRMVYIHRSRVVPRSEVLHTLQRDPNGDDISVGKVVGEATVNPQAGEQLLQKLS